MASAGRENNFNFLRFIFASLVIFSHVPELMFGDRRSEILTMIFGTISFGDLAVDGFFVLSGYLISKSWCDRPEVFGFMVNRILRIYPGFVASVLVCVFVVGPIYGAHDYFSRFDWRGFLLGAMKLRLAGSPGAFEGSHYPALNGSLWTIPWEFRCYILAMLCGLFGLMRWRFAWVAIFLVCALTYVAAGVGWVYFSSDFYYRLGMVFSAGVCFYLYRDSIPWDGRLAVLAMICLLALLFVKVAAEVAVSVFMGYAIIYYALYGKIVPAFNKLPDVSYGVYLYAWPINKVVLWHLPDISVVSAVAAVLLLSCLAGLISWHLVEKPFLMLKRK